MAYTAVLWAVHSSPLGLAVHMPSMCKGKQGVLVKPLRTVTRYRRGDGTVCSLAILLAGLLALLKAYITITTITCTSQSTSFSLYGMTRLMFMRSETPGRNSIVNVPFTCTLVTL